MKHRDPLVNQLIERGYAIAPQSLSTSNADLLLDEVLRASKEEVSATSKVPFLNRGHPMVYNLQNKSFFALQVILGHPVIKSTLMQVLNDEWYRDIPKDKPNYILRSFLARSSGSEAMPLHIDSFIPGHGSYAWSLQVALVLEEQTAESGCTVVVPKSHLADRYATPEDLKDAEPIFSKKGDIVLWDSRIWHGATANRSGRSRWAIIGTFGRWWLKQNYDLPRALPEEFYSRLSDEEKAILGYCSIPPMNEHDRIDIKSGYASLRNSVADY